MVEAQRDTWAFVLGPSPDGGARALVRRLASLQSFRGSHGILERDQGTSPDNDPDGSWDNGADEGDGRLEKPSSVGGDGGRRLDLLRREHDRCTRFVGS